MEGTWGPSLRWVSIGQEVSLEEKQMVHSSQDRTFPKEEEGLLTLAFPPAAGILFSPPRVLPRGVAASWEGGAAGEQKSGGSLAFWAALESLQEPQARHQPV